MSLYNMVHGKNDKADILLKILKLEKDDFGRFRDCFISFDESSKEYVIVVYTRCGGGNRESYQKEVFDFMQNHPLYIRDEDDDFDSTYASIFFKVPEKAKDLIKNLYDEQDKRSHQEKWNDIFNAMDDIIKSMEEE